MMKKDYRFVISCMVLFSLFSCITVQNTPQENTSREVPFTEREDHNNGLLERTYDVGFNRIDIDVPIDTEILFAYRPRLVVNAPPEMMERFRVEESHGELRVFLASGFTKSRSRELHLRIYTNELFALKSSNRVNFRGKVRQRDMEIVTSGSVTGDFEVENLLVETHILGQFHGSVWADQLQLHGLDNSKIDVSGRSNHVFAEALGSTTVDAKSLNAEYAEVETLGKGHVLLGVSREVKAVAKDKSNITIFKNGEPKVTVDEQNQARINVR